MPANLNTPLQFPCDCGSPLTFQRVNDDGDWWAQHGDNPEHRSGLYTGSTLFGAGSRRWRDAIHRRAPA